MNIHLLSSILLNNFYFSEFLVLLKGKLNKIVNMPVRVEWPF